MCLQHWMLTFQTRRLQADGTGQMRSRGGCRALLTVIARKVFFYGPDKITDLTREMWPIRQAVRRIDAQSMK
jgi:hypothetical protein